VAESPDFDHAQSLDAYVAGYQVREGDETTPLSTGTTPVRDVDYGELDGVHRTLLYVEDTDGAGHWYWIMGDLEDADDVWWQIVDWIRSGQYQELGE
jgi:hypothetical protein